MRGFDAAVSVASGMLWVPLLVVAVFAVVVALLALLAVEKIGNL